MVGRRVLAMVLLLGGGCRDGGSSSSPPSGEPASPAARAGDPASAPVDEAPPADVPPSPGRCTLDVRAAPGELRVDGTVLPDLRPSTVEAVLGAPDRVEITRDRERFEEFGAGPDDPPTSMMVEVVDRHLVYDDLGIVVRVRSSSGPAMGEHAVLRLFFDNERRFTNTAAPKVVPRGRGRCTLALEGRALDPTVDVVPAGVDYRTATFDLLGRAFGPTSIATQIDSLYSDEGSPSVRIYLDDATTHRPSYAEILP